MIEYKRGDRVVLVTSGGYRVFQPGDLGTVTGTLLRGSVMVAVDGDSYSSSLCFHNHEVKPLFQPAPVSPFPLEFEDRDGDPVVVMRNGGGSNELYVKTRHDKTGSVLTKEQALELAAAIQEFYRTH